jgi:glycosyltransferase involved in cell wall biosynthesis
MDAARNLLGIGINKKVLLSFGAIRPYKGLSDLLKAMQIVSKKYPDILLIVAGAFWDPIEKYVSLAKDLGITTNVIFINKYIPDSDVHKYFCVADAVILSHRTATQSAIPQLAYIYSVPIISTNVSGNKIFVDDGINGFVVPPRNPIMMANAICNLFSKGVIKNFRKASRNKVKQFEWTESKEKLFFGNN